MDLRKFTIWDTLYHYRGDILKFKRPKTPDKSPYFSGGDTEGAK